MSPRISRLALAAAFGLVLPSCTPPSATREIRNVLLVSIDTLRADRLGCYGFPQATSPHIDALAADGTLFRRAISSAPITLPSHSTMLTGTTPLTHGVHDNDSNRLAERNLTLAEILQQRGFATGAVIGSSVLKRAFGLAQGFDVYDDETPGVNEEVLGYPERPAREVSEAGIAFLETHAEAPFFLLLHYYDPHYEYSPPEPYASRFPDDPYAGEIAYTDAMLGRVFEALERLSLRDSTLVVVTSDHGESFGEHGEIGHVFFVYQSTAHIPLVVRGPGLPRGQVIEDLVGSVDLVPTILGLLGIPVPAQVEGIDLSGRLRGEEAPHAGERFVYCESLAPSKLGCNSLFGLVSERWKYIHTTRPELYDLSADPHEERNLVGPEPEVAAALRARLEGLLARGQQSEPWEIDPQTRLELMLLGYWGKPVDGTLGVDPQRPDPKDSIEVFNHIGQILARTIQGNTRRARFLALDLLEKRPDLVDVHRMLGDIALDAGDWPELIARYERYLQLSTQTQSGQTQLGGDEAWRRARLADIHNKLGAAHIALGAYEAALPYLGEALRIDAAQPSPYYNLGKALLELGRGEEADTALRQALRLDPAHQGARDALEGLAESVAAPTS